MSLLLDSFSRQLQTVREKVIFIPLNTDGAHWRLVVSRAYLNNRCKQVRVTLSIPLQGSFLQINGDCT